MRRDTVTACDARGFCFRTFAATCRQGHIDLFGGKTFGDRQTDTDTTAGDDGNLAVETKIHPRSSPGANY